MTIRQLIEQLSALEKTYGGDTEVGVFNDGDLVCLSHTSTMNVFNEDGKTVRSAVIYPEEA